MEVCDDVDFVLDVVLDISDAVDELEKSVLVEEAPLVPLVLPVLLAVAVEPVGFFVCVASAEPSKPGFVANGRRYVFTSVGSAVNQAGVEPALNSAAMSDEAAA